MAKQEIHVRVAQQHSGGNLTVETTYTSDGVVVKTHKRTVKCTGGGTVDSWLYSILDTTAFRRVQEWEAQELLW